jgi:Dynamin family
VTGPATTAVAEALADAGRRTGGGVAERLRVVRARAAAPPAVAVAGRVSSGKSTLVNALVGRRVAPTDAGECTQVVSRFRFGRAEQVVVHTRDGEARTLRLDDAGAVPACLDVPPEEIDHVEVALAVGRLRAIELVDTPGVSSATAAGGRAASYLGFDLASREAVARADAVVYVLSHTGRADEADDLVAFGSGAGGRADAAVGVLGKADLVAGGDRAAGVDLADRLAARFRDRVATVVPVWSLVAETVACGRLREADAATIDAVAALDDATRAVLLADGDLFSTYDAPVAADRRRRVVDLLAPAGARFAVQASAAGARGAARLAGALDELSGRAALDAAITRLGRRADVVRAARMLVDAEKLAYDEPDGGGALRDVVERLRATPALHVLEETAALDDLDDGLVVLPAAVAEEGAAILAGESPAGCDVGAIDRWREVEVLARDPRVAQVARVVARTLTLRAALPGAHDVG